MQPGLLIENGFELMDMFLEKKAFGAGEVYV
jgi:hypothetical protein